MRIRKPRTAVGRLAWVLALLLMGCHRAQQPTRAEEEKAPAEVAEQADEARGIAEASLGKQAEILAQGDLAQNGREQLLVINRFSTGAAAGTGNENPSSILITRAAILEKNGDKWSEILLCDEHLKNPNGYLGGSPVARVNGWHLEIRRDTKQGLETHFTPAGREAGGDPPGARDPANRTVVVRWNTNVKRYQSLDQSHERYLDEAPSLETPQSILK
jgi:hypothetical protein